MYIPCENCENRNGTLYDCYDECVLAMAIKCNREKIAEQRETIESLNKKIEKFERAKTMIIAAAKEIK